MKTHNNIFLGNALDFYPDWDNPMVIISDGPYGVSGYDEDLNKEEHLPEWYEPHIKAWSEKATPQTTLWFWNTELGWALVHPILQKYGWEYRGTNIWDKGIKHIAGNCNGKTMRKFPVVTEVCAHYVRKPTFIFKNNEEINLQNWLRAEWQRSGLAFAKANEACGVKNAASRKYLTKDHLWYFPPKEIFQRLVSYANEFGKKDGAPYFALNGEVMTGSQWECLRSKFNFEYGVSNVWTEVLEKGERIKIGQKAFHPNQKPLSLMQRIILSSSDEGDLIWEPFGGTFSGSRAAIATKRNFLATEENVLYYDWFKRNYIL